MKPFEQLNSKQLEAELRAREEFDYGTTKKDRTQSLKLTLQGAQRVPTLLLNNPMQTLSDVNLNDYTVLDCEPLHDWKGHLNNLFTELPAVLDKQLATEVKALLAVDLEKKEKKTGGDYRIALVHLLALLRNRPTPPKVLQLLETILRISELLYADESKRSPKTVLRLQLGYTMNSALHCSPQPPPSPVRSFSGYIFML